MTSNKQFQSTQCWLSFLHTIFSGGEITLKPRCPTAASPRAAHRPVSALPDRAAVPCLFPACRPRPSNTNAMRPEQLSFLFPQPPKPTHQPVFQVVAEKQPPVSPPESRSLYPHGLCPCLANIHQVTESHETCPLPAV